MANEAQLELLEHGVDDWNTWRENNLDVKIDLSGARLSGAVLSFADLSKADLSKAYLPEADLSGANLTGADLTRADLLGADLTGANLSAASLSGAQLWSGDLRRANLTEATLLRADLRRANLSATDFRRANLTEAILTEANLIGADLTGADLTKADLSSASLSGARLSGAVLRRTNLSAADLSYTNLSAADLSEANLSAAVLMGADLGQTQLVGTEVHQAKISGSNIYGINVWDLKGELREQKDLIITPRGESVITVDNIKVAQFIYLVLSNHEIREILDTLTSKSVLILGRFTLPERKEILDALKNELRKYNLLPIVFDFDRPVDKDFTETIKTLAGLSYFVIADITDPMSLPLELQATIPDYQIPFVPIIQEGKQSFAMMVDLQKKYNWVLETRTYRSKEVLISKLKEGIIDPAMQKHNELRRIKAQELDTVSLG